MAQKDDKNHIFSQFFFRRNFLKYRSNYNRKGFITASFVFCKAKSLWKIKQFKINVNTSFSQLLSEKITMAIKNKFPKTNVKRDIEMAKTQL